MRLSIFILFFFYIFSTTLGQSTIQGPITLFNQAAVDSFPIKYPQAQSIVGGGLYIGPENPESSFSDINNLMPLTGIRWIEGNIVVSANNKLGSLLGLHSIDSTKGSLTLYRNHGLRNLQGLDSLRKVGGINIWQNNQMVNLYGINLHHPNNTRFYSYFSILENEKLQNLQGLDSKSYVSLYVKDNPSLYSLSGLDSCMTLAFVEIENNDALLHFGNFPNLSRLEGGWIKISENDNLIDFAEWAGSPVIQPLGLSPVWRIFNNKRLQSLKGLNNVVVLGVDAYDNPMLTKIDGLNSVKTVVLFLNNNAIDTILVSNVEYARSTIQHEHKLKRIENAFPNAQKLYLTILNNDSLEYVIQNAQVDTLGYVEIEADHIIGFNTAVEAEYVILHPKKSVNGFNGMRKSRAVHIRNLPKDNDSEAVESIIGFNGLDSTYYSSGTAINDIYIDFHNPGIHKIDGFHNFRRFNQYLNIAIYGVLDTLSGFEKLEQKSSSNESLSLNLSAGAHCKASPDFMKNVHKVFSLTYRGLLYPLLVPELRKITSSFHSYGTYATSFSTYISPSLDSIGYLDIQISDSLVNLEGFQHIKAITNGGIQLKNNEKLSDCSAICTLLEFGNIEGTIRIDNPLANCMNEAQVRAHCDSLTIPINELANPNADVLVFPNPVGTSHLFFQMTAEFPQGTSLKICTSLGQVLYQNPIQKAETLGVSVQDFPEGLLFYQILGRNGVVLQAGKVLHLLD